MSENPGRLPTFRQARAEMAALLASLPDQQDEPGATDEVLAELAELAPARGRVNAYLLGDPES